MTSSPTCLATARDSPVIIDSSTSAVAVDDRRHRPGPGLLDGRARRRPTAARRCGTSSVPSAATRSAVSGSRSREGGQRALCLRDRPHLEPVPEQHDRDEGGQLPPDLDLEEAEGAGPRGHEGDDDRQRDEGHHPGLAVGQLALGSADEDQPAVEEDDRPEDRRRHTRCRGSPGSCSRSSPRRPGSAGRSGSSGQGSARTCRGTWPPSGRRAGHVRPRDRRDLQRSWTVRGAVCGLRDPSGAVTPILPPSMPRRSRPSRFVAICAWVNTFRAEHEERPRRAVRVRIEWRRRPDSNR